MASYYENCAIDYYSRVRENDSPYYRKKTSSRSSVLSVDDDPQIQRLFLRMLDKEKYALTFASNSKEAVRMAIESIPDMVLLDLHLSHTSESEGISCLKDLRKNGYRNPVYIVSADESLEKACLAVRSGANGYLVKGNVSVFFDLLKELVNNKNQSDSTSVFALTPAASIYLRSRGLSEWDIRLLNVFMENYEREKQIALILERSEASVRKQFHNIRKCLGAKSQSDLGRILGILACFAEVGM